MPVRTSGPLYVTPRSRRDKQFVLLLSNLSGGVAEVQLLVYAAPFNGLDSSNWTNIVNRTLDVGNGTIIPVTVPLRKEYAYYHFFIDDSILFPCFHTTLYLFRRRCHNTGNLPLIKGNEWEIVPNLPPLP